MSNFLGVYYKWDHNAKGSYKKLTMAEDVKKLLDVYNKFSVSDTKVQKIPGATGTTLCKSELKDTT